MIGQSDIRRTRRMTQPASRRSRSLGFLILDLIPELVCGSLLFVGIGLALAWLPSESKEGPSEPEESMAAPRSAEKSGPDPIYDLALLGDGGVAWCTVDRQMWTKNTATPSPAFPLPQFHQVMRVAASPRTGHIAVGMLDGSVMVQSDRTSEPTKLGQHRGFVASMAIDAAGATVVSSAADAKVRVFDVAQKKEVEVIDCGQAISRSVSLGNDGRTLLIALDDKILVWDLKTHARRTTLVNSALASDLCALTISPDSRFVAAGRFDGSVDCWDLKTGELVWSDVVHEGPCLTVEFSREGRSVLTGTFRGHLVERDAQTGEHGYEIEAHAGALRGIRSIDQSTVLTFGYDGQIRRWNVEVGTEVITR
jgi:WD40 repeat protein